MDERVLQDSELTVATDHPRLDPLDATCSQVERTLLRPFDEVRAQRIGLAPHGDGVERPDVEHATDVAVRVVRDEHGAVGRQPLDAAGDVDRVAGHRTFARCSHRAEQDGPGVHADPDGDVEVVGGFESFERVAEIERRSDRPLGIVLAGGTVPHTPITASPMCLSMWPP